MKIYTKFLLLALASGGLEASLLGIGLNPFKWGRSQKNEQQAAAQQADQKIDPELLQEYKNRIRRWRIMGQELSSPKTALQKLNEIIPERDAIYRKHLVNEKNGKRGVKILGRLLARTDADDRAQVFESYVREWQLDLDEAEMLHLLVQVPRTEQYPWSRVPLVKKAIELGADPNKIDQKGNRPLHLISCRPFKQQFEILQVLVESGADLDAVDASGQTVAHKKAQECTDESRDMLIYLLFKDKNNEELRDHNEKSVKDLYMECMKKR